MGFAPGAIAVAAVQVQLRQAQQDAIALVLQVVLKAVLEGVGQVLLCAHQVPVAHEQHRQLDLDPGQSRLVAL